MSAYPDDLPRRPRDRRPPPDYDGDDDDNVYRRSKPRDQYNAPRANGRDRRRDTYDASDEDDDPRRSSRDHGSKAEKTRSRSSDIPPPPIGEDRRPTAGGKQEPEINGRPGDDEPYARRKSLGSRSDDKGPYDDVDKRPQRRRSTRNPDLYDDGRDLKKSHRSRDDYDDFDAPRRSYKPRDQDRYDDYDRPRRSKPDPYDDEMPRRTPSRRDGDPRRRRPSYPADDTEPEYDRRRRSHKPSKYDDGYAGYGTDRPRRQPRDDYDRGYRTDGRDSRRDRHRSDGRRDRDDRYRDDYDDYDRRRHSGGGRRKRGGGHNIGDMVEQGQKNWKKVEPIAKPILAQLAQTYLHNTSR